MFDLSFFFTRCEAHVASKCATGHPFAAGSGGGFFQHFVDLFQGETLSFRNKEVCERQRKAAETTPDEENLRPKVGITRISSNQVRSDDRNDLISNFQHVQL